MLSGRTGSILRRVWRRRLRRRPLLPLLVAATLVVDVAIATLYLAAPGSVLPGDWSAPARYAAQGVLEAQVALVAIWLAVGGGSLAVRLCVSLVACHGYERLLALYYGDLTGVLTSLALAFVVVVAIGCHAIARVATRRPRRRRMRVSIFELMAWTLFVALAASVARYVAWNWLAGAPWGYLAASVGCDALLAITCFGAAMLVRRVWLAGLLVAVVAVKCSLATAMTALWLAGSVGLGDAIAGELPARLLMALTLFTWLFALRSRRVEPAAPRERVQPPEHDAPVKQPEDAPQVLRMRIDVVV